MVKAVLFSFFILCFCKSFSQQTNGTFYVYKADWTAAKSIDSCTYFMQEIKKSDSEYVCRYYNKLGPMVKQETYKDADLTTPNGRFCWYNEKGAIDSCGLVNNFKKDGHWEYFYGDSLKPTFYEEYNNGKFVKRNAYHTNDTTKEEKDSTQKEAQFGNGAKDWVKYLSRNLKTPDRLINNFRPGIYMVMVCFLIDKTGKVNDLYLRKSVEWSADAEIFEIILKTPLWKPAIQKGRPVFYRQVENISFSISN